MFYIGSPRSRPPSSDGAESEDHEWQSSVGTCGQTDGRITELDEEHNSVRTPEDIKVDDKPSWNLTHPVCHATPICRRKWRVTKFCGPYEAPRAQRIIDRAFIDGLAPDISTGVLGGAFQRTWSIFEEGHSLEQDQSTVRLDISTEMEKDEFVGGLLGVPNLLETVKREMGLAITSAAEALKVELPSMPFLQPFLSELQSLASQTKMAKSKRAVDNIQIQFDEIGDRYCAAKRSTAWRRVQ